MRGKNCGPFFEFLWRAINRAFAFRIKYQDLPFLQAVSAVTHGVHQVGVGIHRDQPERPAQEVKSAMAEDFAGSDVEHVLEEPPGNLAGHNRPVEKTLMVRREDEWSVFWQLFFAAHAQV